MKERTVLVVHGHFYQPPRENPWTEEIDDDPSAAPLENWNARINAECYRCNAYARIYDGRNRVARMINNFAHISFNVGATLGHWLDRHDPQVVRRIRQGNDYQRGRLGAGGAMAQVWSHPIAPLLSARDLRTQIAWGIHDFQRRFGYRPAGMWLPETAANEATLAALIDAGIAFTIVAPEQVAAVRAPGGAWQEVSPDSVDTGRPYRFLHPDGSGRQLSLCVFDGPLSRELAFGGVTRDADTFLAAAQRTAARSRVGGKRLVLAASDGELYGHHKRFADLTLAYALGMAAPGKSVEVTNLEAFLAENPPSWELRLQRGPHGEGTAWSCSHGLGRWLRDCGCRMDRAKARSQAWRAPLRQALDLLRDRAAELFDRAGRALFADPWKVRDDYGEVVDQPLEVRQRFLRERLTRQEDQHEDAQRVAQDAALLLEMQRSLLLMYTSCAWFFDDISGGEAAIALRRAAHAIELWKRLGGQPPEEDFLRSLAQAHSNEARLGTGADAFARACRARVTGDAIVARRAMLQVLSSVADRRVEGFALDGGAGGSPKDGAAQVEGVAEVVDLRTGVSSRMHFMACREDHGMVVCEVDGQRRSWLDLGPAWAMAMLPSALHALGEVALDAGKVERLLHDLEGAGRGGPGAKLALRALEFYLETLLRTQGRGENLDYTLALRLFEHARAGVAADQLRCAQDLAWEHVESFRFRREAVPKGLQNLLDGLGATALR